MIQCFFVKRVDEPSGKFSVNYFSIALDLGAQRIRFNNQRTIEMTLINKSLIATLSFLFFLAASPMVSAAENPFGMTDATDTMQLAGKDKEGKCAEGKCGEGKCGDSMRKDAKEGKCGQGKCGDSMKKSDQGKCGGAGMEEKKEAKCGQGKSSD
jgi:uncharacterized low-complexity protein